MQLIIGGFYRLVVAYILLELNLALLYPSVPELDAYVILFQVFGLFTYLGATLSKDGTAVLEAIGWIIGGLIAGINFCLLVLAAVSICLGRIFFNPLPKED
jgi:hypothetical protein